MNGPLALAWCLFLMVGCGQDHKLDSPFWRFCLYVRYVLMCLSTHPRRWWRARPFQYSSPYAKWPLTWEMCHTLSRRCFIMGASWLITGCSYVALWEALLYSRHTCAGIVSRARMSTPACTRASILGLCQFISSCNKRDCVHKIMIYLNKICRLKFFRFVSINIQTDVLVYCCSLLGSKRVLF